MGPAIIPQAPIDQENPPEPDPPSKLRFDYCHDCQTTWLVGKQPYSAHPSHDNGNLAQTGSPARSLIVHIFGTSVVEGGSTRRSALGVYFGPASSHNISRNIDTPHITIFAAIVSAAVAALRYVRTIVRRQREHMIRAEPTGMQFRLIIATNTGRFFEKVSMPKNHWKFDEKAQVYHPKTRKATKHDGLFTELLKETDLLADVGVQVKWYLVSREFNQQAEALANDALANKRMCMLTQE